MHGVDGKRLVVFAGKGGVGKTTCSAAAALHLARTGKRVLLVTVDPAKRLEDSLGVPVGATETPIQPNLWALMLDPEAVLREHLAREVPQAKVTEHPLFRQAVRAVPGLNELMAIGKLNDVRRANAYDVVVVDTAPTGHALSFLGAPKAIEELVSDRSILKWAVKGYAVWQKLAGTARNVQNVFKRGDDRKAAPPDIDFEAIFDDIAAEARRIRAFLSDPEHSALVIVAIPERLPVEETCDLHDAVTKDLGMHVAGIVVNKVQPDPLQGFEHRMAELSDPDIRDAWANAAAKGTHDPATLHKALLAAAEFGRIRRAMNLEHIALLRQRLPAVPRVLLPLDGLDVHGLRRLRPFGEALWDPANRDAP